jgi:hypothetical protein
VSIQTDLETVLRNASWGVAYPTIEAMASAAIAKGWKPDYPPTIDTVSELDALPLGSIVRAEDTLTGLTTVFERRTNTFFCWTAISEAGRNTSEAVFDIGIISALHIPRE